MEWINIKLKLPDLNDRVLTIDIDGFVQICSYLLTVWTNPYSAVFMDEQDEQPSVCYPTHWMRLPDPPVT